ncbi:hypothetical protein EON65_08260 [archaeon]|nr:MAG: hypothetical protein EON65_08260 [archaeon]
MAICGTIVFICVYYCTILARAATYVSVDVPQSEVEALQALYTSTWGTNWRWRPEDYGERWNFSTPTVSPCSGWQGVTCGSITGDPSLHIMNVTLASYNLTGSLPSQLASLFLISFLDLDYNYINGTIPNALCNLTKLEYLSLRDNRLGGTIPACLQTNLTNLYSLSLHRNYLHGSISKFGELINLRYLSYSRNYLTGTLPSSIQHLTNLEVIYLSNNMLHGSLNVMGYVTSARLLSLSFNLFSTTFPASYGQLALLNYLYIEENLLYGSLPTRFGSMSHLIYLTMFSNLLTGSLPESMSNLTLLIDLSLDSNLFSGSLSESVVGNWTYIEHANLYINLFSGSLPSSFSTLGQLSVLLVQQNLLTGSLHAAFNSSAQPLLQALDVSSNRFTDVIPNSIFGDSLTTFVAYDCCFSGRIPSSVCNAKHLVTLVLDGLTNACSHRIWPDIPESPRYARSVPGSIPSCVWTELHNLTTLHVSGNGLSGTIPALQSYGQLSDLELAFNSLTGSIPSTLQQWTKLRTLNLESNKLVGTIKKMGSLDYSYGSNKDGLKLYLSTNRLSDTIPTEIESANQINIVEGNLFSCSFYHEPPHSDPNNNNFTCGSTMVDIALEIFAGVAGLIVVALLLVWYLVYCVYKGHDSQCSWNTVVSVVLHNKHDEIQQHLSRLDSGSAHRLEQAKIFGMKVVLWRARLMSIVDEGRKASDPRVANLVQFVRSLQCIFLVSVVLMVLSVGLGLPMYAVLKEYYRTYTRQYRWEPSGVFLSGYQPAIAIILFWAILLFFTLRLIVVDVPMSIEHGKEEGMEMRSMTLQSSSSSWHMSKDSSSKNTVIYSIKSVIGKVQKKSVWLALSIFCANIIFIFAVKGIFVYALVTSSTTYNVKMLMTVLLGGVDVFWGAGLVPYMINRLPEMDDSGKMMVKLCTVVTNSIFASVIAIMLADASCFQGLFVPQHQASEDYEVQFCGFYSVTTNECVSAYFSSYTTASYTPVFYYNYNCYSTVMTEYVPIFFISYCFLSLAIPLGSVLVAHYRQYAQALAAFYPAIFWTDWQQPAYAAETQNTKTTEFCLDQHTGVLSVDEVVSELHVSTDSNRKASTLRNSHPSRLLYPAFILAAGLHHVMVMLTFGLLYPPLNVLVCLLVCITVFTWETLIGRWLLAEASERGAKADQATIDSRALQLDAVCASVCCAPHRSLVLLAVGSGVFIGLACWDIAGDQLGWEAALWAPLGAIAISLCIVLGVQKLFVLHEHDEIEQAEQQGEPRGSYASDYFNVIRGSSLWKRMASRSQSTAAPSSPSFSPSPATQGRTESSVEMSVHSAKLGSY